MPNQPREDGVRGVQDEKLNFWARIMAMLAIFSFRPLMWDKF